MLVSKLLLVSGYTGGSLILSSRFSLAGFLVIAVSVVGVWCYCRHDDGPTVGRPVTVEPIHIRYIIYESYIVY